MSDPLLDRTTTRLGRAYWIAWADITGAAGIGFLWLLVVGAALLVAAKFDASSLGAHADPVKILTAIVIVGLASLRAPVHAGGLTISVLPLGALIAFGWGFSDAVRRVVARLMIPTLSGRVHAGLRAAWPFAAMCCIAALVFRFRSGPNPVGVTALGGLLAGFAWGGLFGAIGGLRSHARLGEHARAGLEYLRRRSVSIGDGIVTGAWMTVFAAIMSSGVVLVVIIVALARGEPRGLDVGSAVAAVIYLAAFWPNVVMAVLTIALGGVVTAGASVTLSGKVVSLTRTYSYYGWAHRSTPWVIFFLVLVPLVSCVAAGLVLHANQVDRTRALSTLVVGALVFAMVGAVVAAVAPARLGAGLVGARGFAALEVTVWQVFVLALAWAAVCGTAAWLIADRSWTVGER